MIKKSAWVQKIMAVPKWFWLIAGFLFLLGLLIGHTGSKNRNTETGTHAEAQKVEWWTCSMHPQIKLPAPGQCPICFMDLIPLVTGDSDSGPRELKMSEAAIKLAEIITEPVRRGAAKIEVRLPGKIMPDERRVKTITAWVPGRLEKLFVNFTGTTVQHGDPLVELYSPALYAAQEELLQALKQSETGGRSTGILIEATREKLSQLGLTDNQIQDIEKKGVASERLNLVSPISGVVIHKAAMEGDYVDKGTEIYTIADLSGVWVVLDAYEKDAGTLRVGQTVSFEAEALPGTVFTSKIAFIDPVLDNQTRSVAVRLDVPNPKGSLKPGMFIRAVVKVSWPVRGAEPLLIPASAPLITGKRAVVYVKKPDAETPSFEGRDVVLGPRVGDFYIVESGLEEGEAVVVKGNFKIDSDLQIQAKPSMMNPEGGVIMTGHANHGGGGQVKSSKEKSDAMAMSEMESEPLNVSPIFRQSLKPVYDSYLRAQNSLSKDQFDASRDALIELRSAVSGLQTPEDHAGHIWLDIQKEILALTEHAPHWSDIEAARKAFGQISLQIIRLEKTFGHARLEPLYQAHCPMAFDNQGADWLQTDSTITNPYFGSKMLRCGEIKKIFESK